MALSLKDAKKVGEGLYRLPNEKDYLGRTKYFGRWAENGKKKTKVVGYHASIKEANIAFAKLKNESTIGDAQKITTLNELYDKMKSEVPDNKKPKWAFDLEKVYDQRVREGLGKERINTIDEHNILDLVNNMQRLPRPGQTNTKPLSDRSRKKVLDALYPIFQRAAIKKDIAYNPVEVAKDVWFKTAKVNPPKVEIKNPDDVFRQFYNGIMKAHGHNPYWCSFFLFGLIAGRRKEEISHLQWEDIDLENNTYMLRDTKSGKLTGSHAPQMFHLPQQIAKILKEWEASREGWVFPQKKDITKPVVDYRKAWAVVIEYVDPEYREFTLHKLRNIVSSTLDKLGAPGSDSSLHLAHSSEKVTDRHYRTRDLVGPTKRNDERLQGLIGDLPVNNAGMAG